MDKQRYELIKNNVQLKNVELFKLHCTKKTGTNKTIKLGIERKVEVVDLSQGLIFLTVDIDFENEGPFSLSLVLKGSCTATNISDITEEEYEKYLFSLTVPLLLPYARECISNMTSRMNLPAFYLPTMDILESLSANDKG